MKHIKEYSLFRKSLNEAKLSKIHNAAKKGSYPVTLVVIENGKVVKQELVGTPQIVPAAFNQLKKEYPKATVHVESKTGERLFSESVVNEGKLKRGDKITIEFDDEDGDYKAGEYTVIGGSKGGKELKGMGIKIFMTDRELNSIEYTVNESVTDASNNLEKIFGTDQETMDMFQRIEDEGTVKDMIEFIDEFGNEEMLSRYGIRSTAQVKKLAKTIMNEATDVNDPVLIAFRATRRDLPKLKIPKVKSRRLSFDKYMDLLDARMDVDQQIKDLGNEMAQTLRDMEQEAEPEGGEIADKYGTTMMNQEKEYAKLKAKKDKIMARIEKHRMS